MRDKISAIWRSVNIRVRDEVELVFVEEAKCGGVLITVSAAGRGRALGAH